MEDARMYPRGITFEAFADLLDKSTITSRVDQGFGMTTTGINNDLGYWTVVQTLVDLTIISQWEPDDASSAMDGQELYLAINSARNASRRAGGISFTF